MKNWFGEHCHPTDQYIHWGEREPQKLAAKLRPIYDKLAAVDKKALDILLQQAYTIGQSDEADFNNPDL